MTSSSSDNNNSNICTDCGTPIGWSIWKFWKPGEYKCAKEDCTARLCQACHNKRPLFVCPPDPALCHDLDQATLKKFCKSCFHQESVIDFDKTYDRIEGMKDNNVTFVFLHGGGSSRALFHAHATELRARYGHGSILLDLPGHASLVETPLSLESCATTLQAVLKECNLDKKSPSNKLIYVGGSFGAYTGFYMLDKFQNMFDGAILMDCGQNVGPGASYKAKTGLVMLAWMGNHLSNATLITMMKDITDKSPADYKLMETVFGAGMWFDQAQQQVNCLGAVAPEELIPTLDIPILFMNGTEDHRDCEEKWLELCVNEQSELKDYEGGDHFFTHDSRFLDDILTRWHEFSEKL